VDSVQTPKDPSESSEDSDSENTLSKVATNLSLNQTPRKIKLVPPKTLETTLFDRLEAMYGASIKRMLEIQYRFVVFIAPILFVGLNGYMQHA